MDETTTYRFSEDAVRQAKQRTLLLMLLFPVPVAVGFIAGPAAGSGSTRFCAFLIAVMFIEVVLIISTTITLKKMRELTLTLSREALERTGGSLPKESPIEIFASFRPVSRPQKETVAGLEQSPAPH